jgi:hypothetical protein
VALDARHLASRACSRQDRQGYCLRAVFRRTAFESLSWQSVDLNTREQHTDGAICAVDGATER